MILLRATKTAEQAGAYYVRIQAMARKHQIPLDVEFDEHDTPQTKYIVIVDDYLPVATCRLYAIDEERVMLGRIVAMLRSWGVDDIAFNTHCLHEQVKAWADGYRRSPTIPRKSSATPSPATEWKKPSDSSRTRRACIRCALFTAHRLLRFLR